MFRSRHISIKYRLAGALSVLVLLSMGLASFIIYSTVRETVEKGILAELSNTTDAVTTMVQTTAEVSVRNRLRTIAEKNIDILKSLAEAVDTGVMTKEAAQNQARNILLSQKVGKEGYIYCIRPDSTVVVHPVHDLNGRKISSEWLAQTQASRKYGYLEYEWANPGESDKRKKALYMEYFAPWDWIVSVSAYRNEFNSLVNINDFKESIESYRVGKTGYVFVVSGDGKILQHPWLSGSALELSDTGGKKLFQKVLKEHSGSLTYAWKDPGSDESRQKLMLYRYIPNLDWIVVSASYLDEVQEPLERLRHILFAMGLLTFLLTIPATYYLGARFARPVNQLAASMKEAESGDLKVRAPVDGEGEIAELAMRFNQYMDQLEEFRAGLESEIDERRRAEQKLKLFAMVFENALEGISITDKAGKIVAVNPAFTDITGFEPKEVLGQNPRMLKSDRHDASFYREMWESLNTKGIWHGEIWNRRKNGEAYPEILSISSIHDEQGELINHVAVFHDISDMKLKDEQIEHQVYHDALTGLPNRTLAQDRLGVAIAHAKRNDGRIVVMSLDLDSFKNINDSLGHSLGDVLLQEVAERLLEQFQDAETVARFGGDEFIILLEHVEDEFEAMELANRALRTFSKPFLVKGHSLEITTSVGVTMYPDDGGDAEMLMRNAEMAMFQAKDKGKGNYFLFTQEMNDRISQRLELENDMRRALKEEEFTVYFQPKIEIETGVVVGMEALVRWRKSDGTVVSPGDFIPLAEETGLIVPLGEFVLETSCKALQVFDGLGYPDMKVAVNLSPVQFGQDDLVEMVVNSLESNGIPAGRLELEITESTLISDMDDSVEKLNQLVNLGISFAIDDFGTGHSSLYYLKKLPIDVLKIDQSFVRDMADDESDAQIVNTVILMAKTLGMSTVAEGVESQEQLALLRSFGCELVQGYYYSRPLPLEEVIVYFSKDEAPLGA